MSASDPSGAIYTDDTDKEVEKKIKRAFSGGRETLADHKKYGGNPDIDASYLYLKYFFEEDDTKLKELYDGYKSGELMTGELKGYTIKKIQTFLKNHRKARSKVKIARFLI